MMQQPRLIDADGNELEAKFTHREQTVSDGARHDLILTVPNRVRANRVVAVLNIRVGQMLEHGFQSWSTVRRCEPLDVRPVRAVAPRWFRAQMLADRNGAGYELTGDTFLVHDGGVVGFLSASGTFGRLVVSQSGELEAQWMLDDVDLGSGQVIELDPLWIGIGSPGNLYSTYASLAGIEMGVRTTRPLPKVWCSWYQYFGAITPDQMRENLDLAAAHGVEVFQIDDGWQREIGDWSNVNATWGESMDKLATQIKSMNMTAGIWTAPFLAIEGGALALMHPEWLVRNDSGEPTTVLYHGGWGGKVFALDTTRSDVLDHLETTYRHLLEQGYDYFKIDFCHAGAAVGQRTDQTKTRAEALRNGLLAVRAGIGEDAYLLGCGCPLLSAVGIVDAMRVSEDVAPHYDPRLFFDGFPENSVAARNAVEASVLRAPLHRRWFTLDPDCVLLRETETELSSPARDLLAEVAIATGGFVALSDQLSLYSESTWTRVAELWKRADDVVRDIVDPFSTPVEIRWAEHATTFDWDTVSFVRLR